MSGDGPNWRDDDAFRGAAAAAAAVSQPPASGGDAGSAAAAVGAAAAPVTTPRPEPEPEPATPAAGAASSDSGAGDDLPLKVEIPRCAAQEDPDNETKQHTMYTIFCSKGKHGWMVQRRYTQFCQLHAQLLGAVGLESTLPPLPPKKMMGNMDAVFVEQRRVALEQYLQQVCAMAGRLDGSIGGEGGSTTADALLGAVYTFVGAEWLLDDGAQDEADGWMYRTGVPKGGRAASATQPGAAEGGSGADDENCTIL